MSKRIDDVNSDYISKATAARRTINNAQKLSITYFSDVSEVAQGHFNEKHEWKVDNPKYQYNGWGVRDTYGEANDDRNSDIDAKIGILDSRIGFCNSRKGELAQVKSDCQESLSKLQKDLGVLQSAQSSFTSISTNLSSIMNNCRSITVGVHSIYRCEPRHLINGTLSAANTTTRVFSNTSISDGISKLSQYINKGEDIMSGIETIEGLLDERIEELTAQRDSFEGMKH